MALSADTKNRLVVALASPAAGAEVAAAMDSGAALASAQIIVGDVNGVAQDVAMTGDVTIGNTGVTAIGAGKVTNAMVAPNALDGTVAKNVASADVIGGLPIIFEIDIADASADTDVVMTHKIRVTDFWFQATGIGGHATNDTVQLKSTATAITDAVAKTATVNSVKRAATIDPASALIVAGGILRVTAVKATNAAGKAYVLAYRSA